MHKYRVYVAGKLNADAVGYIKNLHRMAKFAKLVRETGRFAVYVPGNDFIEGLVDGSFEYKDYFDNSQHWLVASDAVYVCPGWETSEGTKREIETATGRGIPVFYSITDMITHFYGRSGDAVHRAEREEKRV